MQKKIIALAVASVLTMPAMAYAEATVYGQANLSIDMAKDGLAASRATANQLTSNNSRIGVKGSEDLGGGMSAVWQMEGTVAMDTGTTTAPGDQSTSLFNRDTFLGLSSTTMGTVKLGLLDSPYKRSTRKLDVFADSVVADNRGLNGIGMMGTLGGGTDHESRNANAIDYTSPSFGGFTVAIASVFGAETSPQPTAVAGDKKGTAMSLAAMYEQGPIYATLAIDSVKAGDAGTGQLDAVGAVDDKFTATKLGGGFSTDAFAVNLVLEQLKDKLALSGQETKGTNMYVAGKFNIGSDAVKLAYTKRGETKVAGTAQQDDASQIAFGYDHSMSKNTTVYALYTKVTDEGPVGATTTNADPSALSFGIKHSF